MLAQDGRVAHIDFGFCFDTAPGGIFSIERSPFKLSKDDVMVIGGENSPGFEAFRTLFRRSIVLARTIYRDLEVVVRLLDGFVPGIKNGEDSIQKFLSKLALQTWGQPLVEFCDKLIDDSINALGSPLYDKF